MRNVITVGLGIRHSDAAGIIARASVAANVRNIRLASVRQANGALYDDVTGAEVAVYVGRRKRERCVVVLPKVEVV